jgi:hypothetical protein
MMPVCVIVFALHVSAVLYFFPLRHASPDDPFAYQDMSFHIGQGMDAFAGGRLVGYSPSYMAGYPYGVWRSLGQKAYEAAMLYLPFGVPTQRYYFTIVTMAILTPVLLALAAVASGLGGWTAVEVLAAAAVIYQLCDPVAFFWTFGNVAFPFASALAVLAAATFVRPTLGRSLLAGVIAACAIWAHAIAAVALILGLIASALIARRAGASWRQLLGGFLVLAVAGGALVLPGHWHYLRALDIRVPMRGDRLLGGVQYLFHDLLNDRAYHSNDRRALFHLLLVLSTWQAVSEWRHRRWTVTGLWLAGVLTLGFAYFAGYLPRVRELQPARFVVSGQLFLVVPATLGARRLVMAVRASNPAGRVAAAVIALVFLPSLTGYVSQIHSRCTWTATGLSADAKAAVDWLRRHPEGGRVACEPFALGNLLPHLTGRATIGGGISDQATLPQRWATVDEQWAFGRALGALTPADFLRACRILDVRVLIVESVPLAKLVEATPAVRAATFGALRIYTLAAEPATEIWPGCYEGKVLATHNRITVSDPPRGQFTLNDHYVRGLTPAPGVTVAPRMVAGAGAPFIQVNNQIGGSQIVIDFEN